MQSATRISRRGLFGAGLSCALEARFVPTDEAGPPPGTAPPPPATPAFAGWGEDDPDALGARLGPIAAALLDRADVRRGTPVVVAGDGDGVLVRAAAAAGAEVTAGRPADAAISLFGVSYAGDRRVAAAALIDAVRSGAPIALTAWTGLMAEVLAVAGGPATRSRRWAQFETAYLLFFDFPDLDVIDCSVDWAFADVDQAVQELAAPAAGTGAEDRVRAAVPGLLERHRVAGAEGLSVRASYAIVFARKP